MHRRDLLTSGLALPGFLASRSLVGAASTPVARDQWAHPDQFADPAWIDEHLDEASLRIIALTSPEDFQKGHIPGAVQIDWPDLALTDSADATVESWRSDVERRLTDLGVTSASSVVIYDGGTFYASRLWWILDQLSHEEKRVLNGGLEAWTSSGGETESGSTEPSPAEELYVGTPKKETLARIDEVARVSEEGTGALVDARTEEEFADGHIPGAVNLPFLDNAEPESGGRWKPPADLRAMYEEKGVTPDRLVIPYCSTGVRSAATYFTLTALGYEQVKLYSPSFAEWSSDPSRPVETGSSS